MRERKIKEKEIIKTKRGNAQNQKNNQNQEEKRNTIKQEQRKKRRRKGHERTAEQKIRK